MKNLVRLTAIVAACGAVSGCTLVPLSVSSIPQQETNAQTAQDQAWANAGIDPDEIYQWTNIGVTDPNIAAKWEVIRTLISSNPGPISTSAIPLLIKDGISPDEVKPYADYLSNHKNEIKFADAPGLTQDFETAITLHQKGLSTAQSMYFAAVGVPYNDIPSFVASKTVYDEQKKAALQKCGGAIDEQDDITQLSPYAIQGKCFFVDGTSVSQWLDQNSALVDNDNLYFDFPDSRQQTNSIGETIVFGEEPYTCPPSGPLRQI